MLGSAILDVAIGLTFIFLLLSLISSALKEVLEVRFKRRALFLKQGIMTLLDDREGTGLAERVYKHPMVFGLYPGDYLNHLWDWGFWSGVWQLIVGTNLPPYVPTKNFVAALMDVVVNPPSESETAATTERTAGSVATRLREFRTKVNGLSNVKVRTALLTILDQADGDLEKFRKGVGEWFDSAMDQVAGWYKRWTQAIVFFLGLAVTIGLNVDAVNITKTLSRDKAARDRLVALAEEASKPEKKPQAKNEAPPAGTNKDAPAQEKKGEQTDVKATAEFDTFLRKLDETRIAGLPIGWRPEDLLEFAPSRIWAVREWVPLVWNTYADRVPGWLITAVAITLGAPFWFDLLNTFMVIRSTVKPREKSQPEPPHPSPD